MRVQPLENPYFDLPMIDDFAQAVREDREPAYDGRTGFTVQAVVDAAFESAQENRSVPVAGLAPKGEVAAGGDTCWRSELRRYRFANR